MSSLRNNNRRKSSPTTVTLLLALGCGALVLGVLQERIAAARLLFLLNPRFYPEWTWRLLWLIAIWSILDTIARTWFFSRRAKKDASVTSTLQDAQHVAMSAASRGEAPSDLATTHVTRPSDAPSPESPTKRRRFVIVQKWNLVSAITLLFVALALGKLQDWDYRPVSSTCLITTTCTPPTWHDFLGKGVRLDQTSLNDSRFIFLSRLLGIALLALTVLQIVRRTWLGGICRRVGDFIVDSVLTRALLTLIFTLLLWDCLQYVQTFLCWSFYRYFYMPVVDYLYHPRLTVSLLCPLCVVILLMINLRIVLLAQKEDQK